MLLSSATADCMRSQQFCSSTASSIAGSVTCWTSYSEQRLGRVLHQVEHVVHARDEPVDVVAIERRDENRLQQRNGLVGDAVCVVLEIVDALDARSVRATAFGIISQQLGQHPARLGDAARVLVEQFEEAALARNELCYELHGRPWGRTRGRGLLH